MDKKVTGIVAYITFIGLIIALICGDREGAKFHINQALVIAILSVCGGVFGMVFGWIPILGYLVSSIISIFVLVCIIIGILGAVNDEEREVPILGKIKILK